MYQRRPYRSFISYIDRSREYYAAHGYAQPYAWATHDEVSFTPFRKPLSKSRIGLVTTAGRLELEGVSQGQTREFYAMPTNPVPKCLYTDHLAWDKMATHTEDVDSFLPITRLSEYTAGGRIGSVSPRFYGVPTGYSQGKTIRRDAPRILEWCREDGVDAVLLSAL